MLRGTRRSLADELTMDGGNSWWRPLLGVNVTAKQVRWVGVAISMMLSAPRDRYVRWCSVNGKKKTAIFRENDRKDYIFQCLKKKQQDFSCRFLEKLKCFLSFTPAPS